MTSSELQAAESVLVGNGLTEFERRGQQIFVPAKRVNQYNATLLLNGGMPANFASESNAVLDNTGVFTTRAHMQEIKDQDLKQHLSHILSAVPEVEQASVRWARESVGGRFGRQETRKASVFIMPRKMTPLTDRLVYALRHGVANAVSDLPAENVTVFDIATGRAYTAEDQQSPYNRNGVELVEAFTTSQKSRIEERLAYIPGVKVAVYVKIDDIKKTITRTQELSKAVAIFEGSSDHEEKNNTQPNNAQPGVAANQPGQVQGQNAALQNSTTTDSDSQTVSMPGLTQTYTELMSQMPSLTRVSVGIPKAYYKDVVVQDGRAQASDQNFATEVQAAEQAIKLEVQQTVGAIIGADAVNVHVDSIIQTDLPPELSGISWTDTAQNLLQNWGSAVGLAVFALIALRMLYKSMPKGGTQTAAAAAAGGADDLGGEAETMQRDRPLTQRDQLQTTVRENPEMTAAVLTKWLKSDA
jgi:flagellar biosynthesis/type III secretory pathway M-ring protein FliF/YscJ